GPNGAVGLQRQAEIASADDGRQTVDFADLAGSREAGIRSGRPVSELAVRVIAPGPTVTGRCRTCRDGGWEDTNRQQDECETQESSGHRVLPFRKSAFPNHLRT